MADQSDVSAALKGLITGKLYPYGTPGDNDMSTAGVITRVIEGWPEKQNLDAMMKAGRAIVSIFSPPGMERVVATHSNGNWRPQPKTPATYTIATAGLTITVGGAAPATYFRQNVAALVNGQVYVTTATAGLTSTQVAAALLALLQADFPAASAVGSVITLPAGARVEAVRIGTVASAIREVRRQVRQFSVIVWAPTPDTRKALGKTVDLGLKTPGWVPLGDQSDGLLIYVSSHDDDSEQSQSIWRREFAYTVEYSTIETETQTEIVSFLGNIRDQYGNLLRTERA